MSKKILALFLLALVSVSLAQGDDSGNSTSAGSSDSQDAHSHDVTPQNETGGSADSEKPPEDKSKDGNTNVQPHGHKAPALLLFITNNFGFFLHPFKNLIGEGLDAAIDALQLVQDGTGLIPKTIQKIAAAVQKFFRSLISSITDMDFGDGKSSSPPGPIKSITKNFAFILNPLRDLIVEVIGAAISAVNVAERGTGVAPNTAIKALKAVRGFFISILNSFMDGLEHEETERHDREMKAELDKQKRDNPDKEVSRAKREDKEGTNLKENPKDEKHGFFFFITNPIHMICEKLGIREKTEDVIIAVLKETMRIVTRNILPQLNELMKKLKDSDVVPDNLKPYINDYITVYKILEMMNLVGNKS